MLPRDERISWKEAEQVVRLHRLRRDYPIDVPVSELAEAMNIDASELNGLLADARQSAARPRRRFIDRSGLLSAGLAAAAAVLLLVAFIGIHATRKVATPVAVAPQQIMVVQAPDSEYGIGYGAVQTAPPPQTPEAPAETTETVTVVPTPSNGLGYSVSI